MTTTATVCPCPFNFVPFSKINIFFFADEKKKVTTTATSAEIKDRAEMSHKGGNGVWLSDCEVVKITVSNSPLTLRKTPRPAILHIT